MMNKNQILTSRTIQDFGEQWTAYPENEGVYASLKTLQDICGPNFNIDNFKNAKIVDVGSGSGRIVNMLMEAGAAHVIAVEPSSAFTVLRENTYTHHDKILYLNIRGDELEATDLDYAVSFGVIHHIPEPDDTIQAMYNSLKIEGKCIIWLYGKEGNGLYLFFSTRYGLLQRACHIDGWFFCQNIKQNTWCIY